MKLKLTRVRKFLKWFAFTVVILCVGGCIARQLFYQGPYRPTEKLPETAILDIHCHTAGVGAGDSGCFVSKQILQSYKFSFYLKSFGVTREEVLAQGDALIMKRISERLAQSRHVRAAIILAMDGVVDEKGELEMSRTEVYVPNEFVARETARYTNLLFGASINPYRKDAIERLQWAKDHGAKLVKWIPSIQLIDPADERLTPFYKKLIELKLPLLTHTGQERSFTRAQDDLCDPERLILPLQLGVTVIAAHIASTGKTDGERDADRLFRVMPRYTNLFSEISSLTQVNKIGYLREAVTRPELKGRLLFGTDFPLINTALVSPWFFPLNLTTAQMREIESIENPWDRDVALKQALGVPAEIFTKANELFH
jgi:predicted TIM-barrel fold metal-dependent hydrolase